MKNSNEIPSFIHEIDVLGQNKSNRKGKVAFIGKWVYVVGIVIILGSIYLLFFVDRRKIKYDSLTGKIEYRGNFNELGHQDGKWTYYFENGTTKSELNYDNGQLNGFSREWFPQGQLNEACYYSKGQLNGPYVSYFRNGSKYSELEFKDGKEDGEIRQWDSLGNLISHKIFKEGKEISNIK
jgi:antitoxin component YwqK of YwqJK toxin-antitoxin module